MQRLSLGLYVPALCFCVHFLHWALRAALWRCARTECCIGAEAAEKRPAPLPMAASFAPPSPPTLVGVVVAVAAPGRFRRPSSPPPLRSSRLLPRLPSRPRPSPLLLLPLRPRRRAARVTRAPRAPHRTTCCTRSCRARCPAAV